MPKTLSGLKIKYLPGKSGFTAVVTVEEGMRSETFLTNPKIRQLIARDQLKKGHSFGAIIVEYNKTEKRVTFIGFAPLSGLYKMDPHESFRKTGTAAAIELRVAREIKSRWPDVEYFFNFLPSDQRIEQFRKRGLELKPREAIPFDKYYSTLREKTRLDITRADKRKQILRALGASLRKRTRRK